MNLRHAFPSPRESAEDLQQLFPQGTVVTIDRVEPRKNSDNEEYWHLYFLELEKPISLNKTNAFAIAGIAKSEEMEDWTGTLVKLMHVPVEVPSKTPGGGKEYVPGFRIFPPRVGEVPTLKPKSSLQRMIEQNRRASLTQGGAPSATDAAPIGAEKAAAIYVELEKRNKTWPQLMSHLDGLGMGHLVNDRLPSQIPVGALQPIRKYVSGFPIVKDVPATRASDLIAAWTPPPKQDVIDPNTGEVIKPGTDQLTEDDIPF